MSQIQHIYIWKFRQPKRKSEVQEINGDPVANGSPKVDKRLKTEEDEKDVQEEGR